MPTVPKTQTPVYECILGIVTFEPYANSEEYTNDRNGLHGEICENDIWEHIVKNLKLR